MLVVENVRFVGEDDTDFRWFFIGSCHFIKREKSMLNFHLPHKDMILTILEKDTIRWQTEVKCHIISQIIESQIKRAKRLSQRLRLILDTELRSHNISFFQLGQIAIHYLIADFVHVIF